MTSKENPFNPLNNTIKVVVLGSEGVGKSSIVTRFVNNDFKEVVDSTNGAYFAPKTLPISGGKDIRFDIWDTAGKERYRALNKFFMKDALFAIFVYDPYNKDSFDNLEWYVNTMKEIGPKNCCYVIAENKNDRNDRVKEVDPEEGKEYATKNKAIFRAVSAKSGDGIEDLFKQYIYSPEGLDFSQIAKVVLKKIKYKSEYTKCVQ